MKLEHVTEYFSQYFFKGFAAAIGSIAILGPVSWRMLPILCVSQLINLQVGAAGAASVAAGAVQTIADTGNVQDNFITTNTIQAILDSTQAIGQLYNTTNKTVTDIRRQSGSTIILEPIEGGVGDADLSAIVSLAAWDRWTLEIDDQLAFAVDENIGGAAAYRLVLRLHAIDSKLLVQARAQSVKIGKSAFFTSKRYPKSTNFSVIIRPRVPPASVATTCHASQCYSPSRTTRYLRR